MKKSIIVFSPLLLLVLMACISSIVIASERTDSSHPYSLNDPNEELSIVSVDQPEAFPNTLDLNSSYEDQLKWKEEFKNWAEAEGLIQHLSGESTKGSNISILGKIVRLPDQAFVKAYVVNDDYLEMKEETRSHLPYYAIQNGNSTIMIAEHTGVVVNLILDEIDKRPFDFLNQSIKGYLGGVLKYE
ncbi:hypothetical protein PA598K_04966 [Paenibacillus sp. 598K]|uniref:hypothetical protein n=1 Tax=Paenibacillus sp. 598K TaxID=1117987 RepID=UPI000FF95604|nr:hypothetical protein [Paenibacillus sp. 598K]GBF76492.1 hypothetical protein PA598K_04966 [Paenibacillus sp. 598K]